MIYNNSIKSYIIALKERKSRRIFCEKMLKRKKIVSNFYIQNINSNTIQGNKESHVSLIRKCIDEGLDRVLILEDDFKILGSLDNLPEMPEKWDILYLGGEVLRKLDETKNGWVRCISKKHHAYIVNLKNEKLINEIVKCVDKKGKKYCDWMAEKVQPQFRTYMVNPIKVIQFDGFSDITKKYENYDNMVESMNSFFTPQHTIKNDLFNLKLPNMYESELPNISIITCVSNSRDIFSLTIRNFEESFYPKEKREWIIIEETENEDDCIKDLLPDIKNLKYIRLKNNGKSNQSKILDIAVKHSSNDLILNMDIMGFYSRENMLSRVKLLLKYPDLYGVGTNKLGYYDIVHKKSYLSGINLKELHLSSLCFRKKKWEEKKFSDGNFFKDRVDKFINIPHTFIQYGIVLGTDNDKNTAAQQIFNFYDTWDLVDQEFMDNLGNYIKKKNKFNEINKMEIN